ncbi:MAG: hypothetical protein ACYDD7_23160, partial [Acidimicrobiales bacterium]
MITTNPWRDHWPTSPVSAIPAPGGAVIVVVIDAGAGAVAATGVAAGVGAEDLEHAASTSPAHVV